MPRESLRALRHWWDGLAPVWQHVLAYRDEPGYWFSDTGDWRLRDPRPTPALLRSAHALRDLHVRFHGDQHRFTVHLPLGELDGLPSLTAVSLAGAPLEGLQEWRRIKHLESLRLHGSPWGPGAFTAPASLARLTHAHRLHTLVLEGHLGLLGLDVGMLRRLESLHRLTLCDTRAVRVTSLAAVSSLAALRELDVSHTSVTSLAGIWTLELEVLVPPRGVDPEEVARYADRHPGCEVRPPTVDHLAGH